MDNRFYVSYEAARLLKEKGYNEETDFIINEDGEIFEEKYNLNQDLPDWFFSAPTKAEAIDWLETKGLVVEAIYLTVGWFFSTNDLNIRQTTSSDNYFQTRLEAEDAAIIKALELL